MALLVQGACVSFALSLDSEMRQKLRQLRQGIEHRTRQDEEQDGFPLRLGLAEPSGDAALIATCLDDVFSAQEQRVLVHSLNELLGLAKLGLDRTRIALKSLFQLGLLSGGAAAIFILAVGTFERAAWTLAGAGGVFSLISSLVSVSVAKRAHRRARSFADLVQKLSPELKGSSDG